MKNECLALKMRTTDGTPRPIAVSTRGARCERNVDGDARTHMFGACKKTQCGRKKVPKVKPEWAEGFEAFRKERAELTKEQAEREWEAQKATMMQEEEVAARLYAEMDVLEGPGGGRKDESVHEELVSENVRRNSPREADIRRAQAADVNPFK
jgi:hypothetical protein